MKKRPTVSQLKKKLWPIVSQYIRQRNADFQGYVSCVTCGKVKHWKEVDAGHFIDGRRNAIVYDPRNIHAQCKPCNGGFLNNKTIDGLELDARAVKARYKDFMVKTYGEATVDNLIILNKSLYQFTVPELLSMIDNFKSLLFKLSQRE